MHEDQNNLVVRTLANGATAQLRSVIEVADREEARRIYDELRRIAAHLARKHNFSLAREKGNGCKIAI
jgi:predicted Zn-ribbon and HTH transcriptional regulator